MGFIEYLEHVSVLQKILPMDKSKPPPVNIFEQRAIALQSSIEEKAHRIARNVRDHGEQEFGPMWAQGYAVLPDGRKVFLQQSQDGAQAGETLEINILDTPNCHNRIHIRYDLNGNEINTFEIQQEDGKPIIAYWIYDRPNLRTRVPANLSLRNIVGLVEEILQSVEIASNEIIWMNPGSMLPRLDYKKL